LKKTIKWQPLFEVFVDDGHIQKTTFICIYSIFTQAMRSNRFILKSLTIILLLVFTQKIGVGLYVHNWLHANNCKQLPPGSNAIKISCSCVDDFSMPFSEPVADITFYVPVQYQSFIAACIPQVPCFFPVFYSLRGPPVLAS
jgi:hypothetical protein